MTRKRNSEKDLGISAGNAQASVRRKPASRNRSPRAVAPEVAPEAATITDGEPQSTVSEPVIAKPLQPPTREEIARLAFLYWQERGCQGGSPEEDWLRAERELQLRASATA